MKLIFISDTHGKHLNYTEVIEDAITDDSVLIHCGDFTFKGRERELRKFNKWIGTFDLPKERKLVVAGNHELTLDVSGRHYFESLFTEFTYLRDESVVVDGFSFYFSPWQPYFFNWAFNYHSERAEDIWNMIPDDTDVLITHGPPEGILDFCDNGHVGCPTLAYHIQERVRPLVHAFGHIHEGYGMIEEDGIKYVNASLLDGSYAPINQPIIIEL